MGIIYDADNQMFANFYKEPDAWTPDERKYYDSTGKLPDGKTELAWQPPAAPAAPAAPVMPARSIGNWQPPVMPSANMSMPMGGISPSAQLFARDPRAMLQAPTTQTPQQTTPQRNPFMEMLRQRLLGY